MAGIKLLYLIIIWKLYVHNMYGELATNEEEFVSVAVRDVTNKGFRDRLGIKVKRRGF